MRGKISHSRSITVYLPRLETAHCPTCQYLVWADPPPSAGVPIPDPDEGAPIQELPPLEGPAEDPVGRGAKGGQTGSRFESSSPMKGASVQPGDTELPLYYRCREVGPDPG